ncbi:MAG: hypothetical protein HAW67_04525 [Endozoicomonadaceae bacterium]|nr:hypothetical protein [Endozoicomonadaceae bacterium]MBE8232978.1 hypothetical protein [Endozoicomonadaceae bacterium]
MDTIKAIITWRAMLKWSYYVLLLLSHSYANFVMADCKPSILSRHSLYNQYELPASAVSSDAFVGNQCFSDQSNLEFTALSAAQNILKKPRLSCYDKTILKIRKKIMQKCRHKILKKDMKNYAIMPQYIEDELTACVESRTLEATKGLIMDREKRISRYLETRKEKQVELVKICMSAYHILMKNTTKPMPSLMRYPLARHDKELYSFPEWFIHKEFENKNNSAFDQSNPMKMSDLLKAIIGKECPGEMVLWVHPE